MFNDIQTMVIWIIVHAITIFVLLLFSDINYFAVLSLALRQVDDLLGLHYSEVPVVALSTT